MLIHSFMGPPAVFRKRSAGPRETFQPLADDNHSKFERFHPSWGCLRLLLVGVASRGRSSRQRRGLARGLPSLIRDTPLLGAPTDGCFGGVLYRKTTRRLINSYCDKHAEGLGSKAKSGVPNRRKVRPNGSGRNAVNARKVLHTFQELKADENGNTVTAYFQS